MMGPNVRKLVATRTAQLMVPSGGNIGDALNAIISGKTVGLAKEATVWVQAAIAAVKQASDNPYGDDDEAIAGEILRKIEKQEGLRRW